MDTNEIMALIKESPEGTTIEYHVGNLARDRKKDKDLSILADLVDRAYLQGFCNPHMKRIKHGVFSYYVRTLSEKGRFERCRKNSIMRLEAEKNSELFDKRKIRA